MSREEGRGKLTFAGNYKRLYPIYHRGQHRGMLRVNNKNTLFNSPNFITKCSEVSAAFRFTSDSVTLPLCKRLNQVFANYPSPPRRFPSLPPPPPPLPSHPDAPRCETPRVVSRALPARNIPYAFFPNSFLCCLPYTAGRTTERSPRRSGSSSGYVPRCCVASM